MVKRLETGQSREDYLKAIYYLTIVNGSVRQAEIADYMGLSRPSVSVAIRSMEQMGYLICKKNHDIVMTTEGEDIAKRIYGRHLFFTQLLVQAGVLESTAKKEACSMEHVLSEDSYQKLRCYLRNIVA